MRHGGWFSGIQWMLFPAMIPVLLLGAPTEACAGRNANGALIVHTNDAVSYTYSGDYCGIDYEAPDSCGAAGTRTDKDENTPAVIWLLAAFPDTSSPAVTAIQFGIEHNLPPEQGYFENYEMCGSLQLPDAGWPETGFGNLVSFGSSAHTELLFPYYFFAAYGFEGAYLGTTVYPATEEAKFVDDSVPPVEDSITRFGSVAWFMEGVNECPLDGPSENGGLDVPEGEESQNPDGDIADEGGEYSPSNLAYLRLVTEADSACFDVARNLREEYGFRILVAIGPDGVICQATERQVAALAQDIRVLLATTEPVTPQIAGEPDDPVDTGTLWNGIVNPAPIDTIGTGAWPTAPCLDSSRGLRELEDDPEKQTSVYMMREIGISIVFPESQDNRTCNPGQGIYTENWTTQQRTNATQEILVAAQLLSGYSMNNNISFYVTQNPLVATSIEPIAVPHDYDNFFWVKEVFANLGFASGDDEERGFAFCNSKRGLYGTDWYVVCFIVDDDCDTDGLFADGWGAWAAGLNGSYCVIPYSCYNRGYQWIRKVFIHEVSHLFGATDEYVGTDCDCNALYGYLRVRNGNCHSCVGTQTPCIMRGSGSIDYDQLMYCDYSLRHIGWWDSDHDGAFDPIDHPRSGKFCRIGTNEHPVYPGDRIDFRSVEDGVYVKTIGVSRANSYEGKLVWDGITWAGTETAAGQYSWEKNGQAQGTNLLLYYDSTAPVLSNVSIEVNQSNYEGPHWLRFEFADDDTRGAYIRSRTHFHGTNTPVTAHMLDEFIYHTSGGGPVGRPFFVTDPGYYDLEFFLWDVGGGHNASTTVPFTAGGVNGVGAESMYIPELRLSPGAPTPSRSWTTWAVKGMPSGSVDLEIVGVDGRRVRSWQQRVVPIGTTTIGWDGRDDAGREVCPGKYFLKASTGSGGWTVGEAVIVR